jgi:hypothetical protein
MEARLLAHLDALEAAPDPAAETARRYTASAAS